MRVHVGAVGDDEGGELAVAHALLRRASLGELDEALRIYQPPAPAVVFGRRDLSLPGFAAANAAALELGFRTFVRVTGGRAVAYTRNALVVDHVKREPESSFGTDERFVRYGALLAEAIRRLGVDARVGAVPGEYCPGAHSVNARGLVKLVGTAQRAVRDAWLFSSLIVVDDSHLVRPVLESVYGHLGLPFDSASVGAVVDEAPGLTVRRVEQAVLSAYDVEAATVTEVEAETLSRARTLSAASLCSPGPTTIDRGRP